MCSCYVVVLHIFHFSILFLDYQRNFLSYSNPIVDLPVDDSILCCLRVASQENYGDSSLLFQFVHE